MNESEKSENQEKQEKYLLIENRHSGFYTAPEKDYAPNTEEIIRATCETNQDADFLLYACVGYYEKI